MITYSQFYSFIRPFFLARGGDMFANPETLRMYTNMAIQDVYNGDDATWANVTGTLPVIDGTDYWYVDVEHPIKKVDGLFDDTGKMYVGELGLFCQDDQFKFEGKKILIPKKILQSYGTGTWNTCNQNVKELSFHYVKDYEFVDEESEKNKLIPLPASYIPALVKLTYDWASPISLLVGETDNPDFFAHAENRLTRLRNSDGMTNAPAIKTSRRG